MIAAVTLACGRDAVTVPLPETLALEVVAQPFYLNPLALAQPPGDDRLFVAEQAGIVRIVRNGVIDPVPFLDLSARVNWLGEQGLLGIAFHPDYSRNGWFYVSFNDLGADSRIERYTVSSDPDVIDPASMQLVLAQEQPFLNHNGGQILFGPDGMLYIFFGDGGGDQHVNSQDLGTLLGKILRLDVTSATPYAIPTGNPFRNQAGRRGEIWAYGVRNPWRNAFDRVGGHLYVADVGAGGLEEVNAVRWNQPGVNYGWSRVEGTRCLIPPENCDRTGITFPVVEYAHDQGCSITGGFVYRGRAIPGLRGHYLYSDFCTGFLRSFRLVNGEATEHRTWDIGPLSAVFSFGEDAAGELYILAQDKLLRITSSPE